MCGIAGIVSPSGGISSKNLWSMADQMIHRGPDDGGVFISSCNRVGLAHRRLSILDVSLNGHQPMISPETGITLILNGEIYNHTELRSQVSKYGEVHWRSSSDTETLLVCIERWGLQRTLDLIVGMFAFAVFDPLTCMITLVRDRVGEKPLFYRLESSQLIFASELKSLIRIASDKPSIDRQALDCYLGMGYVPGDACILNGYRKLEPSTQLTYSLSNGSLQIERYWRPPEVHFTEVKPIETDRLINDLDKLLETSVKRQLIADVPIGILLSGGLDSSMITAMASRHMGGVRTFSAVFPGKPSFDESMYSRRVAEFFKTNHKELIIEDPKVDLLSLLAMQFDEPIVDSSMIPSYLIAKLVREYCSVALGGDGGDELFGGYAHYQSFLGMNRASALLPLHLRQLMASAISHATPVGFPGRGYLRVLSNDFDAGVPGPNWLFDVSARRRLLRGHVIPKLSAEEIYFQRCAKRGDFIQRASMTDFTNYLPEDILVKVDRTSMLTSLEIRAPFLDHNVVEFAFSKVPSHFKTTIYDKKIILKLLADRLFPSDFNFNRKQGFSAPLADWLKSPPFNELLHDILLGSGGIFDKNEIKSILNGLKFGFPNAERLFALLMFELWRISYSIENVSY